MKRSNLRTAILSASVLTTASILSACGGGSSSSSDNPFSVSQASFTKTDTLKETHIALTKIIVTGNSEAIINGEEEIVQVHNDAENVDLTIEMTMKNLDTNMDSGSNQLSVVGLIYLATESITAEQLQTGGHDASSHIVNLTPSDFQDSNGQQVFTISCQYDEESVITCFNADGGEQVAKKHLFSDYPTAVGVSGNYQVSDKLNLFIFSQEPSTFTDDRETLAYSYTSIPIQFN